MAQRLFPFIVGGFQRESLKSVRMVSKFMAYQHLKPEELKSFGEIYFDILDALAEKDLSYLE